MDKSLEILESWNTDYRMAIDEWGIYITEADTDTKYSLGDQWSGTNKAYLKEQNREAYVFNEISRVIKQISGHQRRNRLQSVSSPTQTQDQLTSDIITDCLGYVMRKRNGYNVISESFENGSLISGINLMSLWLDYSKDPVNGDIRIDRVPFNSFLMDPCTTKLDLSDCRFITRRIYVSKDEAKALVPSKVSLIDELEPSGSGDDKYSYMPYSQNNSFGEKLLRYDEYWKRCTKKVYLVTDKNTGQSEIYRGKKSELNKYMKEFPFFQAKAIYERSIELHIIIEDQLVSSTKEPYGLNDYPFVPVVGYWCPEYSDFQYKLQGIVRKLRDAQEELNKMRSKASDIIKSQINSGWEIEEGQVKNEEDLYKTGQGIVIARTPGSAPLQRIQPPELSQSIPLMIADLQKNVIELPGGSQELFGTAEGGASQISGTLAKQRAGNALTAFNSLFDNLSVSQKLLSEKIVRMILFNWNPEKIESITDHKLPRETFINPRTGQQEERIVPIDKEEVLRYDVTIIEGLETDSQKQSMFLSLIEMRNIGVEIPDDIMIENAPIPNKSKLLEQFKAQQEAKQQQQQKIEEQQRELENMNIKLNNAKIVSDLSLSTERRARAVADTSLAVERVSEARENVSKAQLNNIELTDKIQDMRQDQIMKVLSFVKSLSESEIENDRAYIDNQSAVADQSTINSQVSQ